MLHLSAGPLYLAAVLKVLAAGGQWTLVAAVFVVLGPFVDGVASQAVLIEEQ